MIYIAVQYCTAVMFLRWFKWNCWTSVSPMTNRCLCVSTLQRVFVECLCIAGAPHQKLMTWSFLKQWRNPQWRGGQESLQSLDLTGREEGMQRVKGLKGEERRADKSRRSHRLFKSLKMWNRDLFASFLSDQQNQLLTGTTFSWQTAAALRLFLYI